MSGSYGIGRSLLLTPPARRPSLAINFPSPPVQLASPDASDLVHSTLSGPTPDGFFLLPRFFNLNEQQTLLSAALYKLERLGGVKRVNGRRKIVSKADGQQRRDQLAALGEGLEGWFRPNEDYIFDEGHMDGVIHTYREAQLSGFSPLPPPRHHSTFSPTPQTLLERLQFLFPALPKPSDSASSEEPSVGPQISTHLLHLAREGWIGAHVDSKTAMGGVLVGVCLGGSRVLRLRRDGKGEESGRVDVLLESGSVYVQMGDVRNEYSHAILPPTSAQAFPEDDPSVFITEPRQRLSIVLRDLPPTTAVSNISTDPLSPAFYSPTGFNEAPTFDSTSEADSLYLSLPPDKAWRAESELEKTVDPDRDRWQHTKGKAEAKYDRRTRDGADVSLSERIKQGMKSRKWGGM